MKTYIGVFILVMLLAAASGCTSQPAKTAAAATTVATTAAATEVPTIVQTPAPTTAAAAATTAAPVATTEAAASVTTVATVLPSMTPSTKLTVIHIRNNTFVPDTLTVLPGTMITWTNDDSATHVVKAIGDAAGKFTSADLIKGGQFTYTFGEATGTFGFADPKYPDLKGAIIVKKGETLYDAGQLAKATTATP